MFALISYKRQRGMYHTFANWFAISKPITLTLLSFHNHQVGWWCTSEAEWPEVLLPECTINDHKVLRTSFRVTSENWLPTLLFNFLLTPLEKSNPFKHIQTLMMIFLGRSYDIYLYDSQRSHPSMNLGVNLEFVSFWQTSVKMSGFQICLSQLYS